MIIIINTVMTRPVEGGGVHPIEQHGQQLLVGDHGGVVQQLDRLGVAWTL